MSFTLDWIVDKRIIYIRNEGELDANDLEGMSQRLTQMTKTAVAPFHIIEDDRNLDGFENISLNAIKQALTEPNYEKLGWAVTIAPENLERVSDILGRLAEFVTDINYERVETLPQALDFLAKHDVTLPERNEWQLPMMQTS
jgi:hypothetical protein